MGYLAIGELDGVPYLQLCENRPYDCLTPAEIDRLVLEIGGTGDEMERRMSAGGDLLLTRCANPHEKRRPVAGVFVCQMRMAPRAQPSASSRRSRP